MGGSRTRRNKNQTPPTNHQTKRHNNPPWSKVGKTTNYHQQNPTEQRNRPIRNNLHKIQKTIRDQPYNTQRPSINTNETRMLLNTTKSTIITLSFTRRGEKRTELDRLIKFGHLERL